MNPRDPSTIGAIIVSSLSMAAFLACLGLAFWHRDQNSISLLVGAVIANSTTTVGYWLGSEVEDERERA